MEPGWDRRAIDNNSKELMEKNILEIALKIATYLDFDVINK